MCASFLFRCRTEIVWSAAVFCAAGCFNDKTVSPARTTPAAGGVVPATKPGAGGPSPGGTTIKFTDQTDSAGVRFTYRNGEESGHFAILESLGGGVALFDVDVDGDLDLFLPGGGEFGPGQQIRGLPPSLYLNQGDWKFSDATIRASVAFAPYYSHGAAAADFDNDGFVDVLVTGYGGLVLFHNQGDGTFAEHAPASGLTDDLWSSSAAWGDFDGDGSLDLYVAHYVNWSFQNHPFCQGPKPELREVCPPRSFRSLPHVLYLSNSDGTFRDESQAAGLVIDAAETGKGLGVLAADVDLDGHLDIYVANDTVPNFLYRNRGRASFEDVSLMSGTSLNDIGAPDGSMGVDLGDYDLDGLPDLWVANFEKESFALYRNLGKCMFQHVSQSTGVTALGGLYVGWGTAFCDFDNDGDEDVFVSNGHVVRYPLNAPIAQRPLLLENEAGKRFVNQATKAGPYFLEGHMGRGAASGDVDNDGLLDLAISRTNQPAVVLKNETRSVNQWIGFRLIGTRASRSAIGSTVRLTVGSGPARIRQVKGGSSYASTSDDRLFFGLDRTGEINAEIRWNSGALQRLTGLKPNRVVTVVEQN